MDLRHLRYFQAVAEELSFSKAAQRLRVAQPALSRAVKELEEDIGVLLLFRTRRSVSITPAGAVLLYETALHLQKIDETTRRVRRTAAGEEGELRLGYIGPPTHKFLGRILKEYRRRYPRVSVMLEERTPERVWEMVAGGRLAVGLTRPVLAHHAAGLHTLLLRKENLCAVFPAGHLLARSRVVQWRQIADEPLIILARREGVGLHEAILAACRRARFTPKLAYTPSLIGTVLNYAEAGAGVGVIPDSVSSLGEGGPLSFRALAPTHTVDLVMVWSDKDESPPAVAFRNLVGEWKHAGLLWPKTRGVQKNTSQRGNSAPQPKPNSS
jgi:DNA-binding transcriptional LysR family regulator